MRLFAFAIAMVLGLAASADEYLYWMVDEQSDIRFDYAKVAVCDAEGNATGGYLNIAEANEETGQFETYEGFQKVQAVDNKMVPETWSNLGGNDIAFMVELWGSTGMVGYSDPYFYGKLKGSIAGNPDDKPTVLNVTGFNSVPEPTSGLLMLLGAAALALRRKRISA